MLIHHLITITIGYNTKIWLLVSFSYCFFCRILVLVSWQAFISFLDEFILLVSFFGLFRSSFFGVFIVIVRCCLSAPSLFQVSARSRKAKKKFWWLEGSQSVEVKKWKKEIKKINKNVKRNIKRKKVLKVNFLKLDFYSLFLF